MTIFCIDKRRLQTSDIIPSYVQDRIKLRIHWCNYCTCFTSFDLRVIVFVKITCISLPSMNSGGFVGKYGIG